MLWLSDVSRHKTVKGSVRVIFTTALIKQKVRLMFEYTEPTV